VTNRSKIDLVFLRSLPLLGSACEQHTQKLAAAAILRAVPSRTILFAEGNRVDYLFVLVCGAVELFSEQDERRLTISVVRDPHPLEVYSIFADLHPLSARVLESSEFVSIPAKLIVELISRDAAFANAFAHELATQSRQFIEDFKKHRLLNSTARIADWMLEQDTPTGNGRINIPFDKRVLASYLGMTPEQLSRGFATLASSAVVKVDGRIITIRNPLLLRRIAHREAKPTPPLAQAPPYRPWRERRRAL